MLNIPRVSWRDLPGYKFGKPLDPAMLSEQGYIAPQRTRANQYQKAKYQNVVYDREYLLEVLVRRVIKPLAFIGKEKLDEVIEDAWAEYCKQSLEPGHEIDNQLEAN